MHDRALHTDAAAVPSVADIPDRELLRRAVKTVRPNAPKGVRLPRWAIVRDAFLLGSTYAKQLCVRFDVDPDEEIKR